MRVSPVKITIAVLLWMISVIAALGVYFWLWLNTEDNLFTKETVFEIRQGASLHRVANELSSLGVMNWPKVWIIYAKITEQTNVKAGEYTLSVVNSPAGLLAQLNEGKVVQHHLTLIEGKRFSDFLAKIQAENKIRNTLSQDLGQADIMSELNKVGIDINHVEGWFYPDTYSYTAGSTDMDFLTRAHDKMRSTLNQQWELREKDLPYKNAYEALIMASIVEKETGVPEERTQIAGVFVRRLKMGMRLQTDPTVIYGMGDQYQGNIRRKDLRKSTPYNTYVINGLPPTPIANPGRDAIYAALHPAPGKTLFFVAKGDGSHYFSETLEEHNRAVVKYQKRRRSDYRSSPVEKNVETQHER